MSLKVAFAVAGTFFLAMTGVACYNSFDEERHCNAAGGHPYPGNGWLNYQNCIFGKDARWAR